MVFFCEHKIIRRFNALLIWLFQTWLRVHAWTCESASIASNNSGSRNSLYEHRREKISSPRITGVLPILAGPLAGPGHPFGEVGPGSGRVKVRMILMQILCSGDGPKLANFYILPEEMNFGHHLPEFHRPGPIRCYLDASWARKAAAISISYSCRGVLPPAL